MAGVSFLKPTDQPTGAMRLLEEMRHNLADGDLDEFRMIVAFVRLGPLLRLAEDIDKWNTRGGSVKAIFGVDQQGTSRQALEFAGANFGEVHVACVPGGPFSPIFHPKVYLFLGPEKGVAYIGSNNLTVGGTETNLETYVRLELDLPADDQVKFDLLQMWDDTLRTALPLDAALLAQLATAGMVVDEAKTRAGLGGLRSAPAASSPGGPAFPQLDVIPPSALPRGSIARQMAHAPTPKGKKRNKKSARARPSPPAAAPTIAAQALVIQIIPHHNGEVFLSKRAVDQDPAFFGWPFAGQTVPKRPSNPSYPQRIPDPVVDLKVYDSSGSQILRYSPFNLNTVYYATKSEIRITVPQGVIQNAPAYSVLVMRQSTQPGFDYDMDIYVPGGGQHSTYLAACNQTMPSGGKPVARRFGWL